jgi:hypothetical protein
MYIRNCPEDSVLRRHFDAATTLRRADWLQQPPSDSVLRRHYDQMHQAAVPTSRAATRPAATTAPEHTAQAHAAESARRGGLFGWLGRLFGG